MTRRVGDDRIFKDVDKVCSDHGVWSEGLMRDLFALICNVIKDSNLDFVDEIIEVSLEMKAEESELDNLLKKAGITKEK